MENSTEGTFSMQDREKMLDYMKEELKRKSSSLKDRQKFLNKTPKTQSLKKKINTMDFTTFKDFYLEK